MIYDNSLWHLADPFAQRMQELNTEYLEMIGERIRIIGSLRPSDINRLEQMARMGADIRRINKRLAEIARTNESSIKRLFRDIGADSYMKMKGYFDYRHKTFIPFDKNSHLQNIISAVSGQTNGTLKNISNSTGFMLRDTATGKLIPNTISQTYQRIIDKAIQSINMGYSNYQTEMRKSINELADMGLQHITYDTATGKSFSQQIDVAVRRNILDGIRQLNQRVQDEVGKQFGADGYEVSAHNIPAPDHAPIQGRQFTRTEYDALNSDIPFEDIDGNKYEAIRRGIGMWNCRHFAWAIIIGVSPRVHTDSELQTMIDRADANAFKDINGVIGPRGRSYSLYECTQLQRNLENSIRREKNRQILARATGDDYIAQRSQLRINIYTKRYNYLVKQTDLPNQLKYRARKTGYNKIAITDPRIVPRSPTLESA